MDAQKALITNIFNNSTLIEVPFFQRPYVWNEELWAKFLEDIEYIVKTQKTHFFGAIILKDAGQPEPGGQIMLSVEQLLMGSRDLQHFFSL